MDVETVTDRAERIAFHVEEIAHLITADRNDGEIPADLRSLAAIRGWSGYRSAYVDFVGDDVLADVEAGVDARIA